MGKLRRSTWVRPTKRSQAEVEQARQEWVAQINIEAQEMLYKHICAIQADLGPSIEVIAERLEITVEETTSALRGHSDLTLTELQLLAIAGEFTIHYRVRSSRGESWRHELRTREHEDDHEDWRPVSDAARRQLLAGLT